MDKLNKFQRLACKAITGAWHSAPTVAIEALLDLTPLHILVEANSLSVLSRLTREPSSIIEDVEHSRIWYRSKIFLPTIHLKTDYITPIYKFERKFDLDIPDRSTWSDKALPHANGFHFYTDGSLINDAAGAGVYCESLNVKLSIPLGNYCSIFLAEIAGITKSCNEMERSCNADETIFIYTDSQAAIKALKNPRICSALTLRCWELLDSLSRNNRIKITWVPGHSGIKGNEQADELARQGAFSDTDPLPEPLIGIPLSIIKREIRKHKNSKFSTYWQNQVGCKQSKNNILLRSNHSKFLINLSRTRLKVYVGVMTGHFDFNKHLTIIGKRHDPGCDLCGEHMDSADHYLCHCPAFITTRYKCLGNFILKPGLIKTLHPRDILNYIRSTGRFHPKYGV